MSTKIGDLYFGVTADTTAASASIDKFAASATKTLGAAGDAIAKTIGVAIGVAVTGMAALTYETLQAGVAYNTLGQSATAAFSTIYESSEAAYGILQQISQLDLTSPFTGSSLVAVSRTLAGFGVAEQDIIQITTALSEATAAMGLGSEALERMALAFGQIQSRGKLAGDEARQLANYGIDAYGLLADKLNLSVAAVRELGQEGKLAADVVLPTLVSAIQERFGGAGQALFKTFAGQIEGLRSIMEGVGSALIEPLVGFNTGGALVEAFDAVRNSLLNFIQVGEGGTYELIGVLQPLADVMDRIADVVVRAGDAFSGWLDGLDENSLTDLASSLSGIEPLLAGIATAGAAAFLNTIPFIGQFVGALSGPLAVITAIVVTSGEMRDAVVDGFHRIVNAAEPLIPLIKDFAVSLVDALEDTVPAAVDAVVAAFDALVPILEVLLPLGSQLLDVLGPSLAFALEGVTELLNALADVIEIIGPETVVMAAALIALPSLFTLVGTAATAAATGITAAATAAAAASPLLLALAAAMLTYGAARATLAGLQGDTDFLTKDAPWYEKLFQQGGQLGYGAAYGGQEALSGLFRENDLDAASVALDKMNDELLLSAKTFDDARKIATDYAESLGFTGEALAFFANLASLEWQAQHLRNQNEASDSKDLRNLYLGQVDAYLELLNARAEAGGGFDESILQDEVDLMKELKTETDAAWEALDRFSSINPGAGIDDFLRSLPDLGKELTDALNMDEGALRNLNISGVTDELRSKLVDAIASAAKEGGYSFDQIKALFDERGLQAVLSELGVVASDTVEKIDPIIAQYKTLDATAEQLNDAVRSLEDQRTTRIRAEIDQLEAGLRDAETAAEKAREALVDLFTGGYQDSAQSLLDDLIGNIDSIGSRIEDALMTGGVLGEAGVRSALGDFNSQIAAIVQAGIEEGLNPQQIIDMLGPLGAALQQVLGIGADRIVTFDWESGITPAAAAELSKALDAALGNAGGLNAAIGAIFNADAQVASLQKALDAKQAELKVDVVFSPEEVQAQLDQVEAAQLEVTPDVSDEAIATLFDEIESILNDDDLKMAVDQANLTQQILDAAQEAQDSVTLDFVSGVTFDRDQLQIAAEALGDDFAVAFQGALEQWAKEQNEGFLTPYDREVALGPVVAGAGNETAPAEITINNDIAVNGNQDPRATASETVAAMSAAAGSGGRLNDLLKRYGPR